MRKPKRWLDRDIADDIYERIASGAPDEFYAFTVIPGPPASKTLSTDNRIARDHTAAHFRRLIDEPFSGNVALGCVFFRPNMQRIDTDNLLKHVCDAATRILWNDDSQVTAVLGMIEHDPSNPRTIVVIGRHLSTLTRGSDAVYPCEVCGTPIIRIGQTNHRKTCSRKCAYTARGIVLLDEPVICPNCGQLFKRQSQYTRFCSRACSGESFRNKRRGHAAPRSRCIDCNVQLKHTRGGRCRACWSISVRVPA